jgi:RNA polymerase sigma factor (sigma-70 family)
MSQEWIQEYDLLVSSLAYEYFKKYPMLECEDIRQTLWMWFITHPVKYTEWSKLPTKDKEKLIAKSLRNAALKYCEKEKSNKSGYDITDLYYYDASVIEAFLPSIIAGSYEMPNKIKDLNFKFGKGEVTDGNNWLVLRSDIEKAFNQIAEAKQNILRLRFTTDNYEWTELAKELNTSPDGARKRTERAINSITRILGGWRSYQDIDTVDTQTEDDDDRTES